MDVILSIHVRLIPLSKNVWQQLACEVRIKRIAKTSFFFSLRIQCTIYLWDIEVSSSTQQPIISFVSSLAGAHLESVNCVRWNSKGTHLASASDDSNIFIWTKAPVITTTDSNGTATSSSTTTADSDNMLGWDKDVPESKERWLKSLPYKCHLEPVLDLAWSKDDQLLVSGSVDKKVIVVSHRLEFYQENNYEIFSSGMLLNMKRSVFSMIQKVLFKV